MAKSAVLTLTLTHVLTHGLDSSELNLKMKTNADITMTDAELDDLENDIRVAMEDLDRAAIEAVAPVVLDSDHVPEDEQIPVAAEMLDRLE